MTAILRRLPFLEDEDEVSVGLERLPVRPYQIIAWVSVAPRGVVELPPQAPRLPVILDTGHSHHFSLLERHLTDWARLSPGFLPRRGTVTANNKEIPLHAAALWIHPNQPGLRDRFAGQPPHRLELREGIAVYPRDAAWPRLPLLGLRALVRNTLHLTMDPERRVVNLRTPDWRTKLVQWLTR